MKKLAYFVPVLLVVAFSFIATRLFASGSVKPTTLVLSMGILLVLALVFRPKNQKKAKPVNEVEEAIRGDFAKDAFADDPQLNAKFQAAVKDFASNLPKGAYNKLKKLEPLCTGNKEKYAVAIAIAQVQTTNGKFLEAARNYTTALVIHPEPILALNQGSCYQRLGELDKARSAYEYALDLDSNYIEAYSAIATTHVADRNYEEALEYAQKVLEKNDNHASALATTAICYGLLKDPVMSNHYKQLAVNNGYSEKKITDTIDALKK